MRRFCSILLCLIILSSFTVSQAEKTFPEFSPPLPTLTIFAEYLPAEFLYLVQNAPDISIEVLPPNGTVTADTIVSLLQNPNNATDIFLVQTNMHDYMSLLSSGACANLSGCTFLKERIDQLPPVLSALCYDHEKLYAIPINIHLPGNSTITTYANLLELQTLPNDTFLTVAILNPSSINIPHSLVLLDTVWMYFSNHTRSLFSP